MKERPIIFSGAMVRAILDGKKTQTRRVVKPGVDPVKEWNYQQLCPYGVAGGRLWIKESHVFVADEFAISAGVAYKDCSVKWLDDTSVLNGKTVYNVDRPEVWKWRPSIHMPRRASRITLEIVSVRCQYLQEISEADALAEGICPYLPPYPLPIDWPTFENGYLKRAYGVHGKRGAYQSATEAFASLWESFNEKRGYGWDTNPLVWAIEFRRIGE